MDLGFVWFFLLIVFVFETRSPCGPIWPGTQYIDQDDLDLRDKPISASQMLEVWLNEPRCLFHITVEPNSLNKKMRDPKTGSLHQILGEKKYCSETPPGG